MSLENFSVADLDVSIVFDSDPISPREWDNAGRMICWHRRYLLGDRKRSERYPTTHDGTTCVDPDDFLHWWKENGRGGLLLPLFLYDHSGLSISVGPFSCPWDSGQVGYVYATRDKIAAEWGKGKSRRVTAAAMAQARKCLTQEVETYNDFLGGNVYGYKITAADGTELDSCWGFYGLEYLLDDIFGRLRGYVI